jgi:transposase-like protein
MSDDTPSPLNNVITIDDERIKSHLDRVTVEETLNALLDAEADRPCNAQRYERSEARRDTRAGHYERGLQAKAGEVRLRVPKLRRQTFETAIIERYRRRESSVEEALIEMYLAGCRCAGSGHHGGIVGGEPTTLLASRRPVESRSGTLSSV